MIRTQAKEFDRVVDGVDPRLGGALLPPLLDDAPLDLDAAAALAAREVVGVRARAALPVEGLARRVADRVDDALLAEHLQVAVDGGEADRLALPAQLGVDLLSAAEAGQAGHRRGHSRRLLRAPHTGAARMIRCHILQS